MRKVFGEHSWQQNCWVRLDLVMRAGLVELTLTRVLLGLDAGLSWAGSRDWQRYVDFLNLDHSLNSLLVLITNSPPSSYSKSPFPHYIYVYQCSVRSHMWSWSYVGSLLASKAASYQRFALWYLTHGGTCKDRSAAAAENAISAKRYSP